MLGDAKVVGFIPTTNIDASRSFYEGTLGLTFVSANPYKVEFKNNGNIVMLVKLQEHTPTTFTILGWEVSDIVSKVKEFNDKGIKFEIYEGFGQDESGIWTAPSGNKVAWFKDPDGNVLSISQH